jgi:hypothetical protein
MTNREQLDIIEKKSRRLNRYTTLPVLLDLLRECFLSQFVANFNMRRMLAI